jgi:hypothetical protein
LKEEALILIEKRKEAIRKECEERIQAHDEFAACVGRHLDAMKERGFTPTAIESELYGENDGGIWFEWHLMDDPYVGSYMPVVGFPWFRIGKKRGMRPVDSLHVPLVEVLT